MPLAPHGPTGAAHSAVRPVVAAAGTRRSSLPGPLPHSVLQRLCTACEGPGTGTRGRVFPNGDQDWPCWACFRLGVATATAHLHQTKQVPPPAGRMHLFSRRVHAVKEPLTHPSPGVVPHEPTPAIVGIQGVPGILEVIGELGKVAKVGRLGLRLEQRPGAQAPGPRGLHGPHAALSGSGATEKRQRSEGGRRLVQGLRAGGRPGVVRVGQGCA